MRNFLKEFTGWWFEWGESVKDIIGVIMVIATGVAVGQFIFWTMVKFL